MIAITVSVEFHDFLERSLPWNAPRFDEMLVVTAPDDKKTADVVRQTKNASLFTTNAFYRQGSMFNKGWALDEAIDFLDTDSWICCLDADTLIPQDVDFADYDLYPGEIHLAQRRQCESLAEWDGRTNWDQWPLLNDMLFTAGCFQLFHTQDPVLAQRPRYPIEWTDAGGSDTDFIAKWEPRQRKYFPWYCLHIGPLKENWCGRVTAYPDNTYPAERGPRLRKMLTLAQEQREFGDAKRKWR